MDNIELILTDSSEEATKILALEKKPQELNENIKIAKNGGEVAKEARNSLESKLGKNIITTNNKLGYEYVDDKKLIETKN